MHKPLKITALIALFSFAAFGQDVVRAPDDDVVKITTSLIQVDVTVTDKDGNPITDLTRDEVEIYENGKKQEITNFSFLTFKTRPPAAEATDEGIPVPQTQRRIDPADVRRTIALVIDDLTLSFESTHFVRKALRNFVETQMESGDLVAIVRTSGGIGALQQFTTDKRQLLAAIEKIRWNLTGLGNSGAFAPIVPDLASDMPNLGAAVESPPDPSSDPRAARMVPEEDDAGDSNYLTRLREDVFVSGTLGAIRYLARGMQELPGRKSVMLFSDGFRLTRPNISGFLESTRIVDQLRLLVDACNRSNVVVYTMDARGLQTGGFTAADNLTFLNANEIEQRLADRRNELFDTQEGLYYLAAQTGGTALANSNDLEGGIERALKDQSYYLVGYQPDEEVFDPATRRFNKLEVRVKRKDVKVRYRSGFFGIEDKKPSAVPLGARGERGLLYAISSPFVVNDIELNLHGVFKGATKKDLTLDAFLHVDLNGLETKVSEDGTTSSSFDLLIINLGDDGRETGNITKTISIKLPSDQYEQLLVEGFVYAVTFPVKKSGGYLVRAAVQDRETGKLGTASQFVAVPNVGKKDLALSGIAVNNVSYDVWNRAAGITGVKIAADSKGVRTELDQFNDTALRRFFGGSVMVYALEAYNVKAAMQGELFLRIRLIKDGKVVFNGNDSEAELERDASGRKVKLQGAVNLPIEMEPGDYALQVIVTDTAAKKKRRTATQFVQFEIISK